jgi:hypothetical protein
VENIPLQAERHSGGQQKLFAFPPESVFAFRPECRSESQRNGVRLHNGIAFTFDRIPHPIQAGEQFAVLRALEIAFERGYRLLRVRSDYNKMRIVLKDDYQAGVVQEEHNLRGMILRLARKFDQIKFAWVPRRRNQEAHFLARKAVLQSTPVVCEDVERFFESGSISKKS